MPTGDANALCLECGLCCNGVLFARGQLQPEDDIERLRVLGIDLAANSKAPAAQPKFKQPCAAFDGCRCRIYSERPQYCRQFECLLLKRVQAGEVRVDAALRVIRSTRRQAGKVERLLRALGEADASVPLSVRFRRTQKRLERDGAAAEAGRWFSELTVAMHDLNLRLGRSFLPSCVPMSFSVTSVSSCSKSFGQTGNPTGGNGGNREGASLN